MNIIRFYNLTQYLTEPPDRICYLRSTDVEQQNIERLLWCITDEMLYLTLYLGHEIQIVDQSTRARGKIERIFLPALNSALNSGKPGNLKDWVTNIKNTIQPASLLATRYQYWLKRKRFDAKFTGVTLKIEKEVNF